MNTEQQWLASLRPSRIREVQAGKLSWTSVEIIDIESGTADATRAALEIFGVKVDLTRVGQARHLVDVLSRGPRAPHVILACHGEDGALVLPELAPEVARSQPFNDRVEPNHLRAFANLEGANVIATGCDTGHPNLVNAILGCGAASYLAPSSPPFWYASFFATVFLFYELAELRSLPEAVDRLAAHDQELSAWQLHVPTTPDQTSSSGAAETR